MENETLFTEKQKFKQWWIWLILLGTIGLVGYGVVIQIVLGGQFGDKPASNSALLLVFTFTLIITFSFFMLRLDTIIKTDGIYVRFFPFHFSYRYYPWEHIQRLYVRPYSPLGEYGGWGLRGFGDNRALTISGNQGLQLEMEENRKLLIGTRKPEEINEILRKIGKH